MPAETVTTYTEQEIWNRIFDPDDNRLCFFTPNLQQQHPTHFTIHKILNLAFDSVNNRLNVK